MQEYRMLLKDDLWCRVELRNSLCLKIKLVKGTCRKSIKTDSATPEIKESSWSLK